MRKDSIIKQICDELLANGNITAYAYDHFRQLDAVELPYVVYRRVAASNFSADGVVYHHGDAVDFELYAADPDEMAELMGLVETAMDERKLFYNLTADTVYIEPNDFYESLYEL